MSRAASVAAALLLGASLSLAQSPPGQRIPVVDPDRLAALGFPRDAKSIYLWSAPGLAAFKSAAAAQSPQTWGPATGFTTISSMDIIAEHNSALFREPDRAYCTLGSGGDGFAQEALTQLQLPEGAGLQYLSLWGYDDEPTYGLTVTLYEFCQAVGFNPPTTTLIGSIASSGTPGNVYDATPLGGYRVNNRDCGYSVRIIFIPGNATCQSDKIQFRKLSVLWDREVSPAPSTATFSDVPPDHPFFQFVEALAKSGITGGCGGGKFCPDSPLTRGQMAVFLAKGLGMGWQ